MSSEDPPSLKLRRGKDGQLEVEQPEGGEPAKPEFKPGVEAPPARPDPAQDIPRDQPNPYWGAG